MKLLPDCAHTGTHTHSDYMHTSQHTHTVPMITDVVMFININYMHKHINIISRNFTIVDANTHSKQS